MSESRVRRFYVRKWLNRAGYHSTASVLCTIDLDHHSATSGAAVTWEATAEFSISDCNRKVDLDFDAALRLIKGKVSARSRGEVENARYKALLLKRTVDDFVDCYLATLDAMEKGIVAAAADYKPAAVRAAEKSKKQHPSSWVPPGERPLHVVSDPTKKPASSAQRESNVTTLHMRRQRAGARAASSPVPPQASE